MTAPIVTDGITRIPLTPNSNASVSGDRIATLPLVYRAPGQLWERLAEIGDAGVVNSPNYTFAHALSFYRVSTEAHARNEERSIRDLYKLHEHPYRVGAYAVGLGEMTRYPNGERD